MSSTNFDTNAPTIKIWADVGGTFTDCFVRTRENLLGTKILSNGVMRGRLTLPCDATAIRVAGLPDNLPDDFWVGSEVSLLSASGDRQPLGAIVRSAADHLFLRQSIYELESAARTDAVIEIFAGLEAPVLATHLLLKSPLTHSLPPVDVRLGTTRGTNALLTRRGAETALVITAGFGDVLEIGEQDRPDLFDLEIKKPPPLTRTIIEVDERLDHAGNVLREIDTARLRRDLRTLLEKGVGSLAICLLHAYVNDQHEKIVSRIAREIGFANISVSSEVAPLIKLVSRAETTTLDGYLNPV